jgi:putative restriction endonuclease
MSRPQLEIPSNIQPVHFLKAFAEYDANGIPNGYKPATTYVVIHNDLTYPPPAITALAVKHCSGVMPEAGFRAGENTNCFKIIRSNGFDIVAKKELVQSSDRIVAERQHRLSLWKELKDSYGDPPVDVDPRLLNDQRVYFGQANIWRDKDRTNILTENPAGVAVAVSHSGIHDADDLGDSGLIYHYPQTKGPEASDADDIQSVKNASEFHLPIFVISKTNSKSKALNVRLCWIDTWDDYSEEFLFTFNEQPTSIAPEQSNTPFLPTVTGTADRRVTRTSKSRNTINQRRFKFAVNERYHGKCVLTDLAVPKLLDAAHLHPWSQNGTDDPRNGLLLTPTVHRALDTGLFAIAPDTLTLVTKGNDSLLRDLGIKYNDLSHLENPPEPEALTYLWNQFNVSN